MRTYTKEEIDEKIDEFTENYKHIGINETIMQDLKNKFE